jgi:hypothetical protein
MTSSARRGHDRVRPAEKEELFMGASFDLRLRLSIFCLIAPAFKTAFVRDSRMVRLSPG